MKRHSLSDLVWQEIRDPNCTACDLHKSAQTVCLLGDGPVPAKGMVIGEAPGWREDTVEIPFSGRSGLFLRRSLRDVGLDPRTLWITNVVSCRPSGNRTPTRGEIRTCSKLYLGQQVERVKPRVILILGNSALYWYLGRKGAITSFEGIAEKRDGITYTFSRHPSKVLRSNTPKEREIFVNNLLLFKRILMDDKKDKIEIHWLKTGDELAQVIDSFLTRPVYLDVETNGLNPFKKDHKIWSLSFGNDPSEVYVLLIDHPDATIPVKEINGEIGLLLRSCPISAHRCKFEGSWLWRRFGVKPRLVGDTKLNKFLMDENEPTGLKHRGITELKVSPWEEDFDWQEPPPPKKLLVYNGRDVSYGIRLQKEIDEPWFDKHPKIKKLRDYVLMPAQEVFLDAEMSGFCIDMELARERHGIVIQRKQEVQNRITELAGEEINLGSPKQVSELLYNKLKLRCKIKTKGGAPSSNESALIRMQGQHPIIDDMLVYRGLDKQDTTYFTPWIKHGPILHALYGFTDTVTGRLNSKMVKDKRKEKGLGASLHQCPRDPFIRNLVIPRKKGWRLVASDWSQIELRLVAHASGDPELCRIYRNHLDAHLETAGTLVVGEITKELRKKAKAVNFGFIYGMWAKKFRVYAKDKFGLELTMEECIEYREKFFTKYRGIEIWHSKVESFVRQKGYISSIFGRVRHLPAAMDDSDALDYIVNEAIRQGINSPIQGAACDLNKFCIALVFNSRSKWDFKADPNKSMFIAAVHDSQLAEVRDDYVKEFCEGMKWTSQNIHRLIKKIFGVELRVPIEMDVTAYEKHWEGKEMRV